MRRIAILCVLGALAALVVVPSTAGARVLDNTTIVLGTSIGKATLGTSKTKLDGRLGPGRVVKRTTNDLGTFVTVRYADHHVDVMYRGSQSVFVKTTSAHYGTTKGIYVGAKKADIKRAYPTARCPTATLCTIGKFEPGKRVTEFRLKRSTITSIGVGIVLD
jgi:hypothetical protein